MKKTLRLQLAAVGAATILTTASQAGTVFELAGLAARGWNAPPETADPNLPDYVNAVTGPGVPACKCPVQ